MVVVLFGLAGPTHFLQALAGEEGVFRHLGVVRSCRLDTQTLLFLGTQHQRLSFTHGSNGSVSQAFSEAIRFLVSI